MFPKSLTVAGLMATAAFGLATLPDPAAAQSRDQIRIVGSSTVYPFTTTVAEQFGKSSGMKTPVVESTGTGGGFKLFCAGIGVAHPDLTNASRAMKKSEFDDCQKNGAKDVVEMKIGFDGLTMAQSKQGTAIKLTLAQLFLAVAKEVPGADGKEKLLLIAKQAGFSKEKFDQCLADKELFNKIVETRTRGNEKFGPGYDFECRNPAGHGVSSRGKDEG